MCFRSSSSFIAAALLWFGIAAHAFSTQVPNYKVYGPSAATPNDRRIVTRKNHISSFSTALKVKFRLDNDDEEGSENSNNLVMDKNDNFSTDNNQLEETESMQYETKAPATTFGAEVVPEAQRPANEYMELLASPLFGWANREPNGDAELAIRLGSLYVALFGIVCWPISGATFTLRGYELHQFFSSNIGAVGFTFVLLLRLYSGWSYVGSRLQSKEIEFEETGW